MKGKTIIFIILLFTILALIAVYFIMEGVIEKYDIDRAMALYTDYKTSA